MFSLLTIEDTLLLDPSEFSKLVSHKNHINDPEINKDINKYSDIVYLKLREKYISKVLVDQGLVISIKSFKIKNDLIIEIEGLIDIKYECNLIVFCPKEGDILYGRICECYLNELVVDCDIIKVRVPIHQLMEPYYYNKKEKLWFWSYEDKNYYYEKNAKCRLKVLDTCFKNQKDIAKAISEKVAEENDDEITEEQLMNLLKKEDFMEIYCSMNQEGLGPVKWWENSMPS